MARAAHASRPIRCDSYTPLASQLEWCDSRAQDKTRFACPVLHDRIPHDADRTHSGRPGRGEVAHRLNVIGTPKGDTPRAVLFPAMSTRAWIGPQSRGPSFFCAPGFAPASVGMTDCLPRHAMVGAQIQISFSAVRSLMASPVLTTPRGSIKSILTSRPA